MIDYLNDYGLFYWQKEWRRGWDSNQRWLLKTKNLQAFGFLTIRSIRTKAVVETRIEHADSYGAQGLSACAPWPSNPPT